MVKTCNYCGLEHNRRSRFCSDSCKMKDYRRRNATVTVQVESVTVEPKCNVTVSTRYMTPNESAKHVRMTVMERLFYRPAHMLISGEYNFVSKPYCACYGVY